MQDKNEDRPSVKVEIEDWGPVKITGNFIVKDMKKGTETSPGEVLLCACGRSCTQPFCDGSHEKKS